VRSSTDPGAHHPVRHFQISFTAAPGRAGPGAVPESSPARPPHRTCVPRCGVNGLHHRPALTLWAAGRIRNPAARHTPPHAGPATRPPPPHWSTACYPVPFDLSLACAADGVAQFQWQGFLGLQALVCQGVRAITARSGAGASAASTPRACAGEMDDVGISFPVSAEPARFPGAIGMLRV
jgi:hypothetical protein